MHKLFRMDNCKHGLGISIQQKMQGRWVESIKRGEHDTQRQLFKVRHGLDFSGTCDSRARCARSAWADDQTNCDFVWILALEIQEDHGFLLSFLMFFSWEIMAQAPSHGGNPRDTGRVVVGIGNSSAQT